MRARTAILVLFLLAAGARAAETPIPPAPTRWVTDTAGFVSAETARRLDARLEAYQRSTGHQLLVYIGRTTGGAPIEDWAVRAFEAWRVGRKGIDDGVVLFIMSDDRQVRIEVGYGLEPQVTDATASRIIREIIVPRIQAGDPDGAVTAGMDEIARAISGQGLSGALPPTGEPGGERGLSIWQMILFGVVALAFLILLVTHPSLAIFLLMNILSGGRRHGPHGGGGWGGGGFIGGGGRSGGGGASGRW
jgi:uncharacterized protein